MKKFGTPNGAGPGSEKENVGLADVGTPPGARGEAGFVEVGVVEPVLVVFVRVLMLPVLVE